jgi:hypothetical protein
MMRVDKTFEVRFKIDNIKDEYRMKCYILKESPQNVIIGNDFLMNNECKLDLGNKNISIKNKIIHLCEGKPVETLDKIFFDSICYMADTETDPLKKVIEAYSKLNECFKEMKIEPIAFKVSEKMQSLRNKSYPIPHKYREGAKLELERLINEEIIKQDKTENFSPAFLIEKKTGDLRLVIDYRELNKVIIDEPFEIPRIFENLQLMGKSKYFSKIDLKNGFNQIPIDELSSKLTGFTLFNKIYTYNRIPFGINSGPKIFQKCVNDILCTVPNCFVYIDDIVIFGKIYKNMTNML